MPASLSGHLLRASLRDDRARVAALPDDPDDEAMARVTTAAFELAVRRRLLPTDPVQVVTALALAVIQRYGRERADPLDLELVVRAELGERVPIADLSPLRVATLQFLMLEQLVYDLGLFDDELDALLAEAEQRVLDRGGSWTPYPA